jgi:hypothetical protein
LDFLEEAMTRGVDLAKAECLAGNLKIYFDKSKFNQHIINYFERKNLTSKLWREVQPLGKNYAYFPRYYQSLLRKVHWSNLYI